MPILDDDVVIMFHSALLDVIIEVQKSSDWVIWSLENQYQTSTLKMHAHANDKNRKYVLGVKFKKKKKQDWRGKPVAPGYL